MPTQRRGRPKALWLLPLAVLAGACASPVGVSRAKPKAVDRYLTQSALTSEEPSPFSLIELRRYDLLDVFDDDPDEALARLHEIALRQGLPSEALFALAELSFLRGEAIHDRGRLGAAVVYAYAFLFPEDGREPVDSLDPRGRIAADLYNRALASTFRREDDGRLVLSRRPTLDLPFGRFSGHAELAPDLGGYTIRSLEPATELNVIGFRNRYRRAGIGAPLAAALEATAPSEPRPITIGPNVRLPLTLVVRIDAPLAQLRSGDVEGRVELFSTLDTDTVDVAGRQVALEAEPTAALAIGLGESRFWSKELSIFRGRAPETSSEMQLLGLRPYRRGRIPVVFVHGTASSPARWADMVNDLIADASLRHRYALWFFTYDSGQPITYSAWQLRDALTRAVEVGDPGGSDPCLRDMVVLGHSQGGLLTKLTSIDAGDHFWGVISDEPLEEARFSEADKQLLRSVLFVEPLPFVTEVIFLATPHRGSYLAGPQLVRRLARRLIRLPADVVRVGAELAAASPNTALRGQRIPTSIDNMSPNHPFIRALAEIPVVPGVAAHSIIAVSDDGPLEEAGDGVVKYESAHIDGVDSELVVQSPHSGMQAAAPTIEEVRRILREHAARSSCPAPPAQPDVPTERMPASF